MEKASEIVKQNTPELKEKSKKVICVTCNKEFDCPIWPWAERISATVRTICDECSEKEEQIKQEKQTKKQEEYRKAEAEQSILREIPKKYQTMNTDRKDIIEKYIGQNLFITGGAGVGKTVLMATMAKIIRREFKNIKWISYPAFIMELQSLFKQDSCGDFRTKTPFDVAEDMAKFNGWLCIDDLGAEKLTDYVRQITYFIINEREQRMLPIIITSNFSLAQIDEMVDPRVSSRIAGTCETIKLTGKDRRIRI
jgi:DNA replication protein DnaC